MFLCAKLLLPRVKVCPKVKSCKIKSSYLPSNNILPFFRNCSSKPFVMGKSDVESLPGKLEMAHKDLSTLLSESPQKDQDDCKNNNNGLVPGFELLTNQVAGHMHNGSTIGMIKISFVLLPGS